MGEDLLWRRNESGLSGQEDEVLPAMQTLPHGFARWRQSPHATLRAPSSGLSENGQPALFFGEPWTPRLRISSSVDELAAVFVKLPQSLLNRISRVSWDQRARAKMRPHRRFADPVS